MTEGNPRGMRVEFSEWLETVTKDLAGDEARKVREEVTAHYQDGLEHYQLQGLSEKAAHAAALHDLGSAKAAARVFRRTYLTKREAKVLARFQKAEGLPRWKRVLEGVGSIVLSFGVMIIGVVVFSSDPILLTLVLLAWFPNLLLTTLEYFKSFKHPAVKIAVARLSTILAMTAALTMFVVSGQNPIYYPVGFFIASTISVLIRDGPLVRKLWVHSP